MYPQLLTKGVEVMTIKFREPVKHGVQQFIPGVAVAFADLRAEEYFLAAGWAEPSSDLAVHTYPEGTVTIDPATVFADGPNRGQPILPATAAEG
jgi:hypothetical protein